MRSFGLAAIPLLDQTQQGTWRGWARYRARRMVRRIRIAERAHPRGRPGRSAAHPVRVGQAERHARLRHQAARQGRRRSPSRATTAGNRLRSVRTSSTSRSRKPTRRSWRACLRPPLVRERGFLARTLRLDSAPAPDWLKARRADGTISIGTLTAGDLSAERQSGTTGAPAVGRRNRAADGHRRHGAERESGGRWSGRRSRSRSGRRSKRRQRRITTSTARSTTRPTKAASWTSTASSMPRARACS